MILLFSRFIACLHGCLGDQIFPSYLSSKNDPVPRVAKKKEFAYMHIKTGTINKA